VLATTKRIYQKLPRKQKLLTCLVVVLALAIALTISLTSGSSTHNLVFADCAPTTPNTGTDSFSNVSIPANGTYEVWSRIKSPNSSVSGYYLQVDGLCATTEGDAALTPNTWTWVNYQNGDTNTITSLKLSAGTHTVSLIGLTKDIEIDRLVLTEAGCKPSGLGNNCVPLPTMTAKIATPTANTTVKGTVPVKISTINANGGLSKVTLYRGTTVISTKSLATNTDANYWISWNTTTLANGTYSLKAVVVDGAGTSVTTANVSVKVDNPPPVFSANITLPTSGATESGTVPVDVSTSAATDGVKSIELLYGSAVKIANFSVAKTPYTYNWNTSALPNGSYSIYVIATDGAGKTTTSAKVSLTIDNVAVPAISINVTPISGSTVSGSVTIQAIPLNASGVSQIYFYIDSAFEGTELSSPFCLGGSTNGTCDSFNTTALSNGTHTIKAYMSYSGGSLEKDMTITVNN
jgi:hypothetical protein